MAKKPLTLDDLRKMGGAATKKKYGREHYVRIGKKGGETRAKNMKKV